ncbi:MAG: hypothetical protein AAFX93_14170 [Verrucomicrobiota bacterium]
MIVEEQGFFGINSRVDARLLPEGIGQAATNVRLERFRVRMRGGLQPPGPVPTYITEKLLGAAVFSDPGNTEWIVLIMPSRSWAWKQGTQVGFGELLDEDGSPILDEIGSVVLDENYHELLYPDGFSLQEDELVSLTQAKGKLLLHREGRTTYAWTGDATESWQPVDHTEQSAFPQNMPRAAWSIYARNRLILPRRRDEIGMSDILDLDTFGHEGRFYVDQGGSDWIVGAIDWQEDGVIVFNRKSIHLISGITDLTSARRDMVTDQYGAVARKTIIRAGQKIIFLNEQGLFAVSESELLKLRGTEQPLSEPIQDQLDQINLQTAENAVTAYHENRLYLAFPARNSPRNNRLAIYSFLNKQWESVDTFPDGFYLDDLIVAPYGQTRRLFVVSREGGLHLIDERSGSDEIFDLATGTTAITPHSGTFKVRRMRGDSDEEKRLKSIKVGAQATVGPSVQLPLTLPATLWGSSEAGVSLTVNSYQPDKTRIHPTLTRTTQGDWEKRFKEFGMRGHSFDVEVRLTGGDVSLQYLNLEMNQRSGQAATLKE